MKTISGNIVDVVNGKISKGIISFDQKIRSIKYDDTIDEKHYIMPGFIDAHVHIESSMCNPFEYSKIALKHGTVAAITDPHEIANVCGIDGVMYMVNNANKTPMKIFTGAPSCVPATPFETSGAIITASDIEMLFKNNVCSHLSEMMNFPGIINQQKEVLDKISTAKKYNKKIDGHAPLLTKADLKKYIESGISTDHECTNTIEAIEKIQLGMKIMLRKSSASNDFSNLLSLFNNYPESLMFCTDDCHPDDLQKGYINKMLAEALAKKYKLFDAIRASSLNAIKHFDLDVGYLQLHQNADFIVVDNLENFDVISTYIDGNKVYENGEYSFDDYIPKPINTYYKNNVDLDSITVPASGNKVHVIQVVENSLLTKKIVANAYIKNGFICSDPNNDILKLVVVNRYNKSKPAIAFIKGFGLKTGAIAGTIAHDSHNIIAVGVNDNDIIRVIDEIHKHKGALVVNTGTKVYSLPLPVAGLMSDKSCGIVANLYKELTEQAHILGCSLQSPFMTLAFMSLLVIPEIKLSDKGLFDGNTFQFINLVQ